MKKSIISALILSLPLLANAAPGSDPLADQYFSNNEPSLTPQEQAAIGIGQKWQTGAGSVTSKPFAGPDGAISYVYTTGQTQIVCAVLQLCDIALQPGENVNNIDVGDPRVTVSPSITGSGATQQLHLIIKPLDVGLDTSLVVTTDRRTYRMRVKTSRTKFMPYVSFTYPEDAKAKWDAIRTREAKQLRDNTIPQTGEYLGNLDFNYKISGSASWKPVRYITMGLKLLSNSLKQFLLAKPQSFWSCVKKADCSLKMKHKWLICEPKEIELLSMVFLTRHIWLLVSVRAKKK